MRWRRFRDQDEAEVRRFLLSAEDRRVAAAARFIERRRADRTWVAAAEGIGAFAFLGAGGSFLPVFAPGAGEDGLRQRTVRAVSRCLALHRVRSVQAIAADASVAEEALERIGYGEPERIDYALMGLENGPSEDALSRGPAGLVVLRASAADGDRLFPLQTAYEREEVVPSGATLNLAACRLALERTLSSRIVLMAEVEGTIVAKANTNARSYNRDQIGGVYVLEEHRGRGIGTRLVAELVSLLAAADRKATLFVKKRNAAAIAAYRRIGFDERGDYRISYYY